MDLGLKGRTALITGGTRGIGAAAADLLESEGAAVIRTGRAELDVTAPDVGERALALGRLDILVNNAGTSEVASLEELTEEQWQTQWELHVMGPMRLMRALAPPMVERGWGRIVNVCSSAGKRPSLTNAAYSVSKAAELSLSRVFADTYAGEGVLVNAVAPGAVSSELWVAEGGLADQVAAAKGISREQAIEAQASKIPRGRFGTPEEIAVVIAFLCSEQAANVTGAAWSVDGGAVPPML
ncbi:MAG: SDR family oxidoreductase [Thermoleophilaceae bacterium]|nr:SDR family oxidoreductase [Thermoleophilaceae bacterium]